LPLPVGISFYVPEPELRSMLARAAHRRALVSASRCSDVLPPACRGRSSAPTSPCPSPAAAAWRGAVPRPPRLVKVLLGDWIAAQLTDMICSPENYTSAGSSRCTPSVYADFSGYSDIATAWRSSWLQMPENFDRPYREEPRRVLAALAHDAVDVAARLLSFPLGGRAPRRGRTSTCGSRCSSSAWHYSRARAGTSSSTLTSRLGDGVQPLKLHPRVWPSRLPEVRWAPGLAALGARFPPTACLDLPWVTAPAWAASWW
jgi:hypothetical protein